MPDLISNGATIHYELHGSGPPLLLLPGIGSDGETWAKAVELLAGHRQVIVMHNSGCGQTRCEGAFGILDMVSDCCALLDHLNVTQADIVGHSLGGMIALRMASAHPERLSRLITVTASLSPSSKQTLLFEEQRLRQLDTPGQ